MFQWFDSFRNAHPKTKTFIFTCFIYGFIVIAFTLYCYARLDFVRSGNSNKTTIEGK